MLHHLFARRRELSRRHLIQSTSPQRLAETWRRGLRIERLEDRRLLSVSGFVESYELQNWTSSGITGGTTSITPSSGPSVTGEFAYDVNTPGAGISFRQASFTAIAQATGVVSFDYDHSGFHSFFNASATFETLGDSTTVIVNNSPTSGNFTFAGSTTINVTSGQPFGFRIGGQHSDAAGRLEGTLSISNITLPFDFFDYGDAPWVQSP